MPDETNNGQEFDFREYYRQQEHWRELAKGIPEEIKEQAIAYFDNFDDRFADGPSLYMLLDNSTSRYIRMKGDIEGLLGLSFNGSLENEVVIRNIYPPHNIFISKYFPQFITHLAQSTKEEKEDLLGIWRFKYQIDGEFRWYEICAFKFISGKDYPLGFVLMRYTNIEDRVADHACMISLFHKSKGYLVYERAIDHSKDISQLTEMELYVTRLVASGKSDKEIADEMGIATGTGQAA